MNQKLTEIAVSTEWKWMCEHWYVFFTLGLILMLLIIMYGNTKKDFDRSNVWRTEERLHDKLVSGEEYKQTHQTELKDDE